MEQQAVVDQAKAVAPEILTWLKDGKELAQAQLPDVASQIITWGFVSSVMCALIALVLVTGCAVMAKRLWAKHCEAAGENPSCDRDRYDGEYVVACVGLSLVGIISFIITFCCIYDAAFVYLAPKVYLIEYLSELVTK